MGLSAVIRSSSKSRVLVLALASAGLPAALYYGVAFWMPDWYEKVVHRGSPGVQQGGRGASEDEKDPPIRLEVIAAEPAVQFEWNPSGDSGPSGAALARFLRIEWAVEQDLIRDTLTATLEIQDGNLTERFPIETGRLAQGSRVYFPKSTDVRLELRLHLIDGGDEAAVAKFLSSEALSESSQPEEAPPPSSTAAPLQVLPGGAGQGTAHSTERQPSPEARPSPTAAAPETLEAPEAIESTGPASSDTGDEGSVLIEKGPALPPNDSEDSKRE